MHEIYTLIKHAELMFISTYYFQIFIYWFISILILLIRSGYMYIIVSFYYSVSSYILRAWLQEVHPNSNLYWIPTEEVTDKTSREVAHTV